MSRKFRKILLIFIILSIGALSVAVYLNYRIKSAVPVSFDSIETTADGGVKINQVSYSGTRDNRLAWELKADSATHYREKQLTLLDGVTAVFYNENGKNYTLTSKDGAYDQSTGLITASGSVSIISSDGVNISTDNLKYDEKSGELSTDDRVVITSPGMNASGKGVLVDIKNERLKIFAEVKTEIKSAEM